MNLFCTLALLASWAEGVDYFVSNKGQDIFSPGSRTKPFATVQRALQFAVNGDSIYLENGSIFREYSLSLSKDVAVGCYGDPALPPPSLRGSVPVSGWQPWSQDSRIYIASLTAAPALLYIDGRLATLARAPDTGWLRVDDGTTDNLLRDAALKELPGNQSNRWTGAQVRWRKWSWWYETRPIAADNGNGDLQLGGSTFSSKVGIGSGYYIDNTLKALDAPGEWWWDSKKRLLYYYPTEGTHPNDQLIEAVVQTEGLIMDQGSITGVELRHYISQAIRLEGRAFVGNCLIQQCEDRAIRANLSAGGSTVKDCHIRDILNVGISWREDTAGTPGTLIENNTIENIGCVPGLGGSGSWHAAGVIIYRANQLQFRYNRITRTGYAGVIIGTSGHTIERNVFRWCMSTLNDGASIYTNTGETVIRENIILDTIGDIDSSHPWHSLGHGIWPEFLGSYRNNDIIGNTVYGSGGNGLWLPNNFGSRVEDNTFLSNLHADLDIGGFEPGRSDSEPNQNHTIRNNLLGKSALPYAPLEPQNIVDDNVFVESPLTYHLYDDRNLLYGSMTGTTFLVHNLSTPLIGASTGTASAAAQKTNLRYLSIPQWQTEEPDWSDPNPSVLEGLGFLFINDTRSTVEMIPPSTVQWKTLQGADAPPAIIVAPFRTQVLLAAVGLNLELQPYYLASEAAEWQELSYGRWLANYGLNSTNAPPTADLDQDGLANLLEFFFGLDPKSQDRAPMHLLSGDGGLVLELSRRHNLAPLSAVLESSEDLVNWTIRTDLGPSSGLEWNLDSRYPDRRYTRIQLPSDQRFLALRVSVSLP